jgi:hypothetical protein
MARDSAKLLEAVSRALDWEACQSDPSKRQAMLAVIRCTVDEWMRGQVTTEQAVTVISSTLGP